MAHLADSISNLSFCKYISIYLYALERCDHFCPLLQGLEKGTPQYTHIESGNQAWQTCASQPYPFASLASALGVDGWKECTYCAMEGAEKIRLICLQTRKMAKNHQGERGVLDQKKKLGPVLLSFFFETWANFSNERDADMVF